MNFENIIAEKTRDIIAPISDYSLYLCHDLTGTTLKDAAPASQQILGDVTVNGTTTGVWVNEGHFTPAGDHQIQKNSAEQQEAGILSTANQIIFFVDFFATGAPTTKQNMFLMYGRTATAGKHAIKFSIETNGRFQIQIVRRTDATTASSNTSVYGNVCDSKRHSLVAVADVVNGVISTFVDGIAQSSVSVASNEWGDVVDSRGWGVFANITSDAPSFNNNLGAGDLAGGYINRMGIMRTLSDQSANIGTIVTGLNDIAHELPWAMDGI